MMLLLILQMMRVRFSFPLKLKSQHLYTFTSPFQYTLKQNHRASHNYYSAKNMLKLLAFKWLLYEFLLETENSGQVNLVIGLNYIHWIFFKALFFNIFIQTTFLVFSAALEKYLHLQKCLLSICRYHYGSTVLLFFCLFVRKLSSSSFILPIFWMEL